ncbi:effector-associated domain EAD1-containing protein [Iningainema tapete]|uniref:Effector-associated domain-containing protein n=1 Tax=Iningainema tapete BLCC-T55 TaxID=2748662 RepID=A0A8J7C723_9CYAN|nr:effector-associated domain EAD1-containing protein [Iningainema tapete]MBD2775094.1 hypothetical protein [Iningainema tapete BLCC-T55]
MRLPGETIRKIREAIKSAFPNRGELIMLLRIQLDIDESEVPDDSNYNIVVFKLVKQLASQGRILDLIKGALNEKPGNPNLQELVQEINTIDFYFSNQPLRKLLPYLLSIIVSIILTLLILSVLGEFFGLRKPIVVSPELKSSTEIVIVESTAGWQDSGIELKENDTVQFDVGGRIHLALRQIINLAEIAKPLIIQNMSDQELKQVPGSDVQELKKNYLLPKKKTKNTFFRKWLGSEGQQYNLGGAKSDMLDRCRIVPDRPWGQLLATVFPKGTKISEKDDPLAVLKEAQIQLSTLKTVNNSTMNNTINFNQEGKLAFVINEAVISRQSPFSECRIYYEKLRYQSKIPESEQYKLDEHSIPMIWFADNVGSFRVKVTVERQASASSHSGV